MRNLGWRKAFGYCVILWIGLTAIGYAQPRVTSGEWLLYRGERVVAGDLPTEQACIDAAGAAGEGEYSCRTVTTVAITADVAPLPVRAQRPAMVDQPVVIAADPALLKPLLDFAETWDRNWNHGGHRVDERFDDNQGRWDYDDSIYEPWLFDRVTVGHRLFELTGDARWRDKFLADFDWYRSRIDAQGYFSPRGYADTKYGYVTPFLLYERMTSDEQYRSVARSIYDSWIREWPDAFNPNALLWTEREVAFALEAAVSWYEISHEPAALARASALVDQWTAASADVGAPLVTYTQHEGGGPGGTEPSNLTNSPWMSALYFQASRRLYEITGDQRVLTQVSDYFDWLDANGFYDGRLAHVEFAGQIFPRYLTGDQIGDAGYDEGNMAHALDVAGLIKFAIAAKAELGLATERAERRLREMRDTALRDFQNWSRSTEYLPRYRVTPPRRANWMIRGLYELSK